MSRRHIVAVFALLFTASACSGGNLLGGTPPSPGADRIVRVMSAPASELGGDPGAIAVDRSGVVAAVPGRGVVALDRHGYAAWSVPLPGAAYSWPAIGNGLVVVPTLESAGAGGCVALERASGARRWSYSEPRVDGVAVANDGHAEYCALSDGVVVAIDPATGARRWRAVLEPSVSRSSVTVPERSAFALDEHTRTLAVTLWIGGHPYLELRHADTGAKRELVDLMDAGSATSPVAVAPGVVAVGASDPGHVCFVDLRRPDALGLRCLAVRAPTGFDPAAIPVVSGDTMVITSKDGWVIAIDVRHMSVRWSVRAPAPILDSHPVVVGDEVLVADWARVPLGLRLRDGSKVDAPRVEGSVVATLADPAGGFDLAVRGEAGAGIERWEVQRD